MHCQIDYSNTVIILLFFTTIGDSRRHGGKGNSHSYPHSTGYSGTSSGTGYQHKYSGVNSGVSYTSKTEVHQYSHNTPQQNSYGSVSHSYPHSTGYSGTSTGGSYVPKAGVSHSSVNYKSNTEIHHHYHYTPPQQITYGSVSHPVYHGQPPVYVYTYQDSGSKFDTLLTGLALYNLGRMSANHHNSYDSYGNSRQEYRGMPDEVCKLGVLKQNGEYEETRIDCFLMSSFILEAGPPVTERVAVSNSVVTTITNVTHIGNSSNTSVTTIKTENVTDALKVKGPSIPVTPGMTCYMIRMYRNMSTLRKNVECGLLQEYARRSLRRNADIRLKPLTLPLNVVLLLSYYILK